MTISTFIICAVMLGVLHLVYKIVKQVNHKVEHELHKQLIDTQQKLAGSRAKYNDLANRWNDMMRRIHRAHERHGVSFLEYERGTWPSRTVTRLDFSKQFDEDEINTLIRLCHPDKHRSSESATEITQKLISMRK